MKELCNLTREQATLYEAVVEEHAEAARGRRGHRAARTRAGLLMQAEADLQPPGALPRRRSGDCAEADAPASSTARRRCSTRRSRKATARSSSPSSRDGRAADGPSSATVFGARSLFLHGGVARKASATGWSAGSRRRRAARSSSLSLKAGGVGPQPDAGQPRVPLRPLVEPRRGEPGHGPGVPHRADEERAGAQAHLRGDPRGEDRRTDREQESALVQHPGHRRGLDYGAFDGTKPRDMLTLRREAVADD